MVFKMGERAPDVAAKPIEFVETRVMFWRTTDDPAKFGPMWERLEALVGLRGRTFFGAFYRSTQEYRVCVERREDDDPAALGLESGTLPGGRYLRARLRGEPPGVYERIGPTFEALVKEANPDETRPSIEFYRQRDEIDLLLPIATSDVGRPPRRTSITAQ
jgi:GyrI-like small molecule binding protein